MPIIDTEKQTPEEIAKILWDEGLLEGVKSSPTETSEITIIRDGSNRPIFWTEETRDPNGIVVSKRTDAYTYYPTGEVDMINQRTFRGEAELRHERDVKHSVDGKVKPIATTLLEYVVCKYVELVTEPTGQIVPLGNVTILPERALVSTIDPETSGITGIQAVTATTYREEDVYDEEGNVIGTKPVTIPGDPIFISLDADGNYAMSGTPQEQVAIVYTGELKVESAEAVEL